MRVVAIALFLIIFQLCNTALSYSATDYGFSNTTTSHIVTEDDVQTFQNLKSKVQTNESTSSSDTTSSALGLFYIQVTNAVNFMFGSDGIIMRALSTFYIWSIKFGLNPYIAFAINSILLVIETIGFIQMFSGRQVEDR